MNQCGVLGADGAVGPSATAAAIDGRPFGRWPQRATGQGLILAARLREFRLSYLASRNGRQNPGFVE